MIETTHTTARPYTIGLTGGIACGKTSIASLFKELNVPIVDADIVARKVVEPGSPLLDKLALRFGPEILNEDGSLNRNAMRKIAFDPSHKENLADLNSIMSPAILNSITDEISKIKATYVIAVIPLLFEHHLEHLVDRVLVVDIAEDLQYQRLIKRDNIDDKIARSMIANQVDRNTRRKKADDLIESDNSALDKKRNVVLKLHNLYQQFANIHE